MAIFNNKFRKFIIITIMGLSPMPLISQPGIAAEIIVPTIALNGTGKALGAPDMAMLSLGVLRQAKTANEAMKKNNSAMAKILAALKNAGIAEEDLRTTNFSIRPQYKRYKKTSSSRNRLPEIIGYTVSNQMSVKINDLKKLGEIIDMTVKLGVNTGGNIQFLNKNPAPFISKARQKAMENAIAKAKTLTNAAGAKLGKILTITENSFIPRPYRVQAQQSLGAPSMKAAVPIASGQNVYSVTVQVSWEIQQ